ncbi:hypothetical protein Tco_0499598 [Tanacetum coccineum]
MTRYLKLLSNFVEKFLGMVKFGNDQIAPILGYGDLVQGNITIKRVYYVKGLNHNLFSVGQFYDANLEVAFWKSTCYIPYLKGNDILTGSRGTDLYSMITSNNVLFIASFIPLIMGYLVKVIKKARMLELKRRYLKITIMTTNTPLKDVASFLAVAAEEKKKRGHVLSYLTMEESKMLMVRVSFGLDVVFKGFSKVILHIEILAKWIFTFMKIMGCYNDDDDALGLISFDMRNESLRISMKLILAWNGASNSIILASWLVQVKEVSLVRHRTKDSRPNTSFHIPASLEYVSGLARANLAEIPRLPSEGFVMCELPDDAIGVYHRIFDSSGVRILFSSFLLSLSKRYKAHFS